MNDEIQIEDPLGCEWIELERPENWQGDKSDFEKYELSRRGKARALGQKEPFERKLSFAIRVIRRAFEKHHAWSVSFSGGNDSTALSLIVVDMMGLKVPHIMSNTRLEYPETIRNAKAWEKRLADRGVELHVAYPDKRPAEVWREDGIPLFSKEIATRYRQWISTGNDNHLKYVPEYLIPKLQKLRDAGIKLTEKCCDELKKKPMKAMRETLGLKGSITGTRAQESKARKLGYLQRGALYFSTRNGQWICNPLVHWLKEDIEEMHAMHDIEIEQIPTESGRSGCVNCGFGCHIETKKGRENSLQILKLRNPTMHKKTMEEWQFKEACDLAGIPTEPENRLFR